MDLGLCEIFFFCVEGRWLVVVDSAGFTGVVVVIVS